VVPGKSLEGELTMTAAITRKVMAWRNGVELGEITVESLYSGGYGGLSARETWVRPDVRADFVRMATDAWQRDRIVLRVNSGFRTVDEQKKLYKAYEDDQKLPEWKRAGLLRPCRPGFSEHNLGVALDINRSHDDPDGDGPMRSRTDDWLDAHADEYGFYRSVPGEPWHWRHR
jgi:LAS superfamily LD-carboxypeptidase LdcB